MQTSKDRLRYDMVLFDAAGTLIGFRELAAFQQFLADANLPAAPEDARRFHQRMLSVIRAERDNAQGLGADEQELYDWWLGIFAQVWIGRPDLAQETLHWLLTGRFDYIFPDVLPALEALQGLGMPMAVLSNFGSNLRDALRKLGILRFFKFVIVSAEVRLAKPDPRIFDLAVLKANCPRRRLLYVGDHIGDDIHGAQAAGLDAILIDRHDQHPGAPCARIDSLLLLIDYVQSPFEPDN